MSGFISYRHDSDHDPLELEISLEIPYQVAEDLTLGEIAQLQEDLKMSMLRDAKELLALKGHKL